MAHRWFIYVPEINPRTFVFFYFKGDTGRSWSVRDYSSGFPATSYAKDFPWAADEVLAMARRPGNHAIRAKTVPTNDIAWYAQETQALNQRHLGAEACTIEFHDRVPPANTTTDGPRLPMLDLDLLRSHAKGRKPQDMRRILTSRRSEDWVTWNVSRALALPETEEWWPQVVQLAEKDAIDSSLLEGLARPPDVELWRGVASPPAYEAASRARMAGSNREAWRLRATDSRPVEGTTEVDLLFDGDTYLVFVEAKLDSDISESTSYDPERNQIVRNIDCVIEEAGDRMPLFWMLVKDRGPGRLYTQLVDTYRRNPAELVRLLPHRELDQLERIARSIAILRWRDLLPLIPATEDTEAVRKELARRI